ncbi:WSC domain-containing protein [Sporothrix schenckii 1099-18]|uniref:DUF1996 domain-containing protein n=2 Tax=Sporothrix schenckii TaxID=29908 RepID=U7PHT5_SPOS1|nr:WSC domain-containing protein [Sporothrix schenckii 1099-18]ERS95148.1 hypothetical protein HMPREF1624_08358 [Sporothrix schenckii ATCC 58251]KJR89936.1 WSC domain-containing protein [Sporothrix schenckii 1099-18]
MVSPRVSILVAAAITPALAFWRMECRGVAGNARIDPLISPGGPSSHLHAIMGSGGFGESATYADITASDCTSCLVTEDKSSYWHPALYFLDTTTHQYELVEQVGGTLAYYLLNSGNGNNNITAFPKDFRMIAGDNERRAFTAGNVEMADPPKSNWAALNQTSQDKLAQRALGFNCLDYSTSPEASLYRHFFPDKKFLDTNCPDGIRFELMFPSCWNGKDVDSANHRSHVAYPDLVMAGDCPDDFPVRLPSLFYETIWNTAAYIGRTGQFVISNGDVQGFSYHGDFMTGWDVALLQEAVNTCTNPSGEISDCPLFTIQSLSDAQACKIKIPDNVASDNTAGPAASLPGNVAPFGNFMDVTMLNTYDPALSFQPTSTLGLDGGFGAGSVVAQAANPTGAAAGAPVPSSPPNAAATTAVNAQVAANIHSDHVFASSPAPPPPSPSPSTPSSVTAPPPSTPSSDTHTNVVSTQYITNGNMVTKILWEETVVYVTEDPETVVTTVTTTPAAAVKPRVHNHMRRHRKHRW